MPELLDIPEFIAKLDPSEAVEAAQRQTKFFGESGYTTLASAKAAASAEYGATGRLTNFVIATDMAVSGTSDSGVHLVCRIEGKGRITTQASGDIFTIKKAVDPGPERFIFGPGRVDFAKGAVNGLFRAGWWVPDGSVTPGAITEKMWDGMRNSLFNNQGGILHFPIGEFTYTYEPLLQVGTIRGSGQTPFIDGTVLKQQTNGNAGLRIMPGSRNILIRDLVIDIDGMSNSAGVMCEGEYGVDISSIHGVKLDNMTINGGKYGLFCNDSSGLKGYLFNEIETTKNCHIIGQTDACIHGNSVNTFYTFSTVGLTPAHNGTARAIDLPSCGRTEITGNANGLNAGSAIPPSDETEKFTFVAADINTTTNVISKTHLLSTGDSAYISNSGGALPVTVPAITSATKVWVRNRTSGTFSLHINPNGAHADGDTYDLTGAGTGTHTLWSTRPKASIASQRPASYIRLGGNYSANVTIRDVQDEGIPIFLEIDDAEIGGSPNYAPTVNLVNCFTQGQIILKASVNVNLFGGQYLPDSFKDEVGVAARVRNFGAQPYTYGVGGPINNRAGYAVPSPYRFDDFQGNSVFEVDFNSYLGDTHARYGNNVPIFGMESKNNAAPQFGLWQKVRRLDAGEFAAFWEWYNSFEDNDNSQSGNLFSSHFAYKGTLHNTRPVVAAGAASGQIILDLEVNNEFTGTLTENATLEFINARTTAQQVVIFSHLTAGTTSYNLTPGTNVLMRSTFATGTVAGVRVVLFFYHDGTRLIEMGR